MAVPPLTAPVCVEPLKLTPVDADGDKTADIKQGNVTVAAPGSVTVRQCIEVC